MAKPPRITQAKALQAVLAGSFRRKRVYWANKALVSHRYQFDVEAAASGTTTLTGISMSEIANFINQFDEALISTVISGVDLILLEPPKIDLEPNASISTAIQSVRMWSNLVPIGVDDAEVGISTSVTGLLAVYNVIFTTKEIDNIDLSTTLKSVKMELV